MIKHKFDNIAYDHITIRLFVNLLFQVLFYSINTDCVSIIIYLLYHIYIVYHSKVTCHNLYEGCSLNNENSSVRNPVGYIQKITVIANSKIG